MGCSGNKTIELFNSKVTVSVELRGGAGDPGVEGPEPRAWVFTVVISTLMGKGFTSTT